MLLDDITLIVEISLSTLTCRILPMRLLELIPPSADQSKGQAVSLISHDLITSVLSEQPTIQVQKT